MPKTLMEAMPLEPPDPELEDEEEGQSDLLNETDHDANLAEHLSDEVLGRLASDLVADFTADLRSIEANHKLIEQGLDLLGVTLQELTEPFEGACAAVFPLMLEAAIQFQARAVAEVAPSGGPVKTVVLGENTHERVKQAGRVKEFMNYQLTEVMEEWYDETDQMLFTLPIVGSCFKKVYFDPAMGRPVSRFIPLEQFVVAYHNTDLRTSGRYTHVTTMDQTELKKLQSVDFYRDIDVVPAPEDPPSKVKDKINRIEGKEPTPEAASNRHTLLEMHVDLDLPGAEDQDDEGHTGIALPYVVTIHKHSTKVMSIRRNWDENDPFRKRLQWFVHYKYLPGLGFFGYGLVHILGNLQKSATAILRSLIDAGQYATLPAFFKARGARIMEGNKAVAFGEYRDIDNFGDDIRKAILPIPTKEPSPTLFQMLQLIVDAARRLASTADINVGDSQNQEQPVGTTLALLEQAVKVMSAIHKRLHKSQREELRILARINRINLPPFYPYEVEGATREVFRDDFGPMVNVLPVSDPNIFSETQRILRAQAMLQLATQIPQVHNMREAVFRMHESIGTPKVDDVLVPDYGPKPMDPATENFAMLRGKPVMAYAYQDHDAHLKMHMAFMTDPNMGGNPVIQQAILPAMMAHLADHKAHQHRLQMQAATGIPLNPPPHYDPSNPNRPDDYEPLPPFFENEVARAQALAEQQLAQMGQQLAQAQQNQTVLQNPMFQLEKEKLAIEKQDSDTKRMDVMMKHQGEGKKEALKAQIDMTKAAHGVQMEREKHAANMAAQFSQQQLEERRLASEANMQKQRAEMEMIQEAQRMQQQQQADQQRANAQVQAAKIGLKTQAVKGVMDIHIQKEKNEAQLEMDRERHQMEMKQQTAEHKQELKLQKEQGKADVQVAKAEAQAYKSGKMAPKGGSKPKKGK